MKDLENAKIWLDKSLLEEFNGNVKLDLRRVE
jgi:hypothetical protein